MGAGNKLLQTGGRVILFPAALADWSGLACLLCLHKDLSLLGKEKTGLKTSKLNSIELFLGVKMIIT